MNTMTCDPLNALNEALCNENEGRAFYLQAAGRTVDSKGAEMFRSLADDSALHAGIIEHQIEAIQEGEAWSLPECVLDCTADLEQALYPRGAEIEQAIRADATETDALLLAIKIENDSFDLYSRHASEASDADARRFYEYLAEEARAHFNLLMLNYESVSGRGGWVG
jgi:rubrerythrin